MQEASHSQSTTSLSQCQKRYTSSHWRSELNPSKVCKPNKQEHTNGCRDPWSSPSCISCLLLSTKTTAKGCKIIQCIILSVAVRSWPPPYAGDSVLVKLVCASSPLCAQDHYNTIIELTLSPVDILCGALLEVCCVVCVFAKCKTPAKAHHQRLQ